VTSNQPSTGQLSKEGLDRLHETMAAHVGSGQLPGLVTLVARGGAVHVDTIGAASFADDTPLARDAIFRIASLTKPITAVATMSLVEEGVLRLEDPIGELVPELADRRVLRAIDAELDDTVPAKRPITLEDLLSYDQPLPCGIGWDGGTGTTWRSNSRSGLTGILFTQRQATSPEPPPVVEDFWAGVNAATAAP
jgi:hypothetical protein